MQLSVSQIVFVLKNRARTLFVRPRFLCSATAIKSSGDGAVVTIDVRHDGLGRLERVCAPTRPLAEARAEALRKMWDEDFQRRGAAAGPLREALAKLQADDATTAAERASGALTAILINAVKASPAVDWTPLYDNSAFAEPPPVEPGPPVQEAEPQPADFPRAPLTLATLLSPGAMRRRRETADAKYDTAHSGWRYLKRWREGEFEKALRAHHDGFAAWQQRQAAFVDAQARANARLDALVKGYAQGDSDAVIGHCDLSLLSLERPAGFPRYWTMSYSGGALQLDYDLPSMDVVPVVKAVKYAPARDGFEVVALPEHERERLYTEAVFQTALAVLYTLFAGDSAGAIRAIAFNGWANYVDGAAMRPGRACILSVSADKTAFQGIDLGSVDPLACFRALNGSMSPKLAALVGR
jgi:hypothetical protein